VPGVGRAIASGALALPLGAAAFFPLFVPLFSASVDIAAWPVDALVLVVASLAAYFVFGVAIGYLNPSWWPVAGVLAWLAVFDALYNLAYASSDPSYPRGAVTLAVLVLVVPLFAALTGAYAGRTLARRRAESGRLRRRV
jgi:hypothetical protein